MGAGCFGMLGGEAVVAVEEEDGDGDEEGEGGGGKEADDYLGGFC